jgi:hypothetical protein
MPLDAETEEAPEVEEVATAFQNVFLSYHQA